MKTAEDIILDYNGESDGRQTTYTYKECLEMINAARKEGALDFFKWNIFKLLIYYELLKDVKQVASPDEIEQRLEEFEQFKGMKFEELYKLYLKQNTI